MERFDGTAIESTLRELRPAPRSEFAAELDTRAAGGFARGDSRVKRTIGRLRATPPRRILAPAAMTAVVAVAVATAVVSTSDRGSAPTAPHPHGPVQLSETPARSRATEAGGASAGSADLPRKEIPTFQALSDHRAIERSAQVTLLASPADVAGDSAEIFTAVHDAHGIVLRSHTTQGPAGRAGAGFYLLIPSARLGDALAAISAIDEVGSRNDATADITAPTVAVGKRLTEAHASVESLLSQIAAAETEAEREVLGAELHDARHRAAALKAQLDRLHKRTRYSRLTVQIETGHSSSASGPWGIDNAFHDAGHVLGVAAGVTLLALAVLAPLALIVLLAWLIHRTWLRVRRERALS